MWLSRKGGLQYVARGDPANYDFNETTLTQDGAWHTLDLSAIIPVNAKLIHLRLGYASAGSGRFFRVKKTGLTNDIAIVNATTQISNVVNEIDALVPCTGQQVSYWATAIAAVSMRFSVLGWFL